VAFALLPGYGPEVSALDYLAWLLCGSNLILRAEYYGQKVSRRAFSPVQTDRIFGGRASLFPHQASHVERSLLLYAKIGNGGFSLYNPFDGPPHSGRSQHHRHLP
jgi:hypothetical protein